MPEGQVQNDDSGKAPSAKLPCKTLQLFENPMKTFFKHGSVVFNLLLSPDVITCYSFSSLVYFC